MNENFESLAHVSRAARSLCASYIALDVVREGHLGIRPDVAVACEAALEQGRLPRQEDGAVRGRIGEVGPHDRARIVDDFGRLEQIIDDGLRLERGVEREPIARQQVDMGELLHDQS